MKEFMDPQILAIKTTKEGCLKVFEQNVDGRKQSEINPDYLIKYGFKERDGQEEGYFAAECAVVGCQRAIDLYRDSAGVLSIVYFEEDCWFFDPRTS
jgi:hypothetical protein